GNPRHGEVRRRPAIPGVGASGASRPGGAVLPEGRRDPARPLPARPAGGFSHVPGPAPGRAAEAACQLVDSPFPRSCTPLAQDRYWVVMTPPAGANLTKIDNL